MEESKEGDYKEEEAKEEEKREEEEDEDDNKVPVVKLVQNFCMTSGFEREFEAFAEDNFEVFSDASEMKDNEEHKLEFYDVYNLYLTTFEKKIEDYILSNGYTTKQFYAECRELLNDEEEYSMEKFFVEALLATSEYDSFFRLMRSEMQTIKRKGKK